ncbi:MAG: branched-chain amino acid aminotransferase [Rhodospirillales bacterium]|nr:branched-chain amino acid aminotransferase [Rhodospirillales bacterium]
MLPYDDRDGFIWMDGEMRPWREAKMHTLTHGMHYGGCVFEGLRAYDGKIFKLREHTERLIQSAKLICIKTPFSVEQIEQATIDTVKANDLTDCYIRPFVWRGSKIMGLAADQSDVHVAIAAWYWPSYLKPKEGDVEGVSLKTSTWRRMDPRSFPLQSKAAGIYAVGTMAKEEATAAGFDDALMLDLNGNVAEASAANLFAVYNGVIKTPKPDCFLNGITRQTVLGLAKKLDIPTQETTITPEELVKADEIFLTGTAAEIVAARQIDNHKIQATGPITKQLQDAYQALVRS